jgi:hypothetical protein
VQNAFTGKAEQPSDADLSQVLGSTKPWWDQLIAELADQQGVTAQEWKSYSRKAGWSLRLLRGKRTIVWLSPAEGCFQATFILGDKAMEAARQSKLSAATMRDLEDAQRYPEGTCVRLTIKGRKDLPAVKKLAVIKIEH